MAKDQASRIRGSARYDPPREWAAASFARYRGSQGDLTNIGECRLNPQPNFIAILNHSFFSSLQDNFPRHSRQWIVHRDGFG